jgi:hypothetical protein
MAIQPQNFSLQLPVSLQPLLLPLLSLLPYSLEQALLFLLSFHVSRFSPLRHVV